jgi:AraC family transcriptional regulator
MLMNSPTPNVAPLFDRNASRLPQAAMLLPLQGRSSLGRQPDERGYYPGGRLHDRQTVERIGPTVEISPVDIVQRRAVSWDGMAAEIVQATRSERIEVRFRAHRHLLVVHEEGARRDGVSFVEGLPRSTLRDCKGKLTFVPAGHEYHEWQEPRSLARVAYFYFDPAELPAEPQADGASAPLAPRLFFEDAALSETARKLIRAIGSAGDNNRLYRESLGMVLAHELVRPSVGAQPIEAPARGGLAGWQQRIVIAYIEEHLAEQIPLATLARLVRLSPYYFCRAFKQSFGLPPHRYHNSRRIEQAKILLTKPAPSVTNIGMTVGFSDTSSFTTAFRKATGLTPSAYHRSLS